MALRILKINSRGQALLEAVPATLLLLVFVVGVLGAAYFIFGRAWLSYVGEQGLYCLAEGRGVPVCRALIQRRVSGALPWGSLERVSLGDHGESWSVEIRWHLQNVRFHVSKRLRVKDILRNKALSW